MTTSRPLCSVLAVLLLGSACGKPPPGTADLGQPCVRNADCTSPFLCQDGRCVVGQDRQCEPATRRCNGASVEVCDSQGLHWTTEGTCNTGCVGGACVPAVCAAGEKKCDGDLLLECGTNGALWVPHTYCDTSCDAARAECAAPVCTPWATRCRAGTDLTLQTCNARGTAWVDSPCDAGQTCLAGRCARRVCQTTRDGDGNVVSRQSRCSGDVREECADDGLAWAAAQTCQYGCQQSGTSAACATAACAQGEEKCQDGAVMRCTPDRRAFGFVQYCLAGCQVEGAGAVCLPPVCTALGRRCGRDPATGGAIVEQCRANGTGWEVAEACLQGCSGGNCVALDSQCVPGERRCNGTEAEQCVGLANGGSEWRFLERCLGLCSGGACGPGGSCGCAGGVEGSSDVCGSPHRPAIALAAVVDTDPAAVAPAPDGVSTFLVHAQPIVGVDGARVPDGALVTFSYESPQPNVAQNLFLSPDADGFAGNGLQRPVLRGRAKVLLRAPSEARQITVRATMGGRCAGAASLTFAVPQSARRSVYVAEDFSTTRLRDRATSTAQWDTTRSLARATAVWSTGTGADGDLVVDYQNRVRDLWEEGYSRGARVVQLGSDHVLLDQAIPGLSAGDEVLLATVYSSGDAETAGSYEFLTVADAQGAAVRFAKPVAGRYGTPPANPLSGPTIVLQRVPQFVNVTVSAGCSPACTLTSAPYGFRANGTLSGSGVLVLRATGTVRVAAAATGTVGGINMSERGLTPGRTQPTGVQLTSSRLLLGSGASGSPSVAGGGAVVVSARTITLKQTDTSAGVVGSVVATTAGGSASGGTIWLRGAALVIGSQRVDARGPSSAFNGRVRLDYGGIDLGYATAPTADEGQRGPLLAQSAVDPGVRDLIFSPYVIHNVRLLAALGGAGEILQKLPYDPAWGGGLHVDATMDGTGWSNLDTGQFVGAVPALGNQFKFRAGLVPGGDVPQDLWGLSFRLDVYQ